MLVLIKKHFLFFLGTGIVLCMAFFAVFAPYLTPYSPTEPNVDMMLLPPSSSHVLGTDAVGRDIFTRLLYGARVSLWVGFIAVGISSAIGIALGLISGYFGGIIDEIIMRLVDIMLCFPSFFLILAVIAFLEPSVTNIMVVIGLTSWTGLTRLVRAETLSLRERDFVLAAKLSGASKFRILFVHILPNTLAPVFVSATLGIAGAILVESSLSFLGLGVQPPYPSWGNMLLDGKDVLSNAPWLSLFSGLEFSLPYLAIIYWEKVCVTCLTRDSNNVSI